MGAIPLSLLTTASLDRIQLGLNLKFRRISFGINTGISTIDESLFPNEDSLSESDFWQMYKNWLALVEIISGRDILEGWRAHHQKMISDRHFSHWYPAWRAHDRLLRIRFMSKPFVIDTKSPPYKEQFERCRTDFSILGDPNAPHTAEKVPSSFSFRPSSTTRPPSSPPPPSPLPSPRYAPYAKDLHPASFQPYRQPPTAHSNFYSTKSCLS